MIALTLAVGLFSASPDAGPAPEKMGHLARTVKAFTDLANFDPKKKLVVKSEIDIPHNLVTFTLSDQIWESMTDSDRIALIRYAVKFETGLGERHHVTMMFGDGKKLGESLGDSKFRLRNFRLLDLNALDPLQP